MFYNRPPTSGSSTPAYHLSFTSPSFSASPSPTSTAPNGRPPKWTIHSMWILITAYMNTHLTLLTLLKVVEAFAHDPADVPKEESAHKKISSIAGKELRWARANNISDSITRLKSHILSPYFLHRTRAAGRPLRLKIPPAISTATVATSSYPFNSPTSTTTTTTTTSCGSPPPSPSIVTDDEIEDGILHLNATIPDANRDRSARTFMKYLYILVTSVPAILSSSVHHRPNPSDPPNLDADFRDSWSRDPDSPRKRPGPTAVPWDLLRSDTLITSSLCPGMEIEHNTAHCQCSLQSALQASAWLHQSPLSGTIRLNDLMAASENNLAAFADIIDCFGNTALHVLALRNVRHNLILHAVAPTGPLTASAGVTNSLGQTFLHLLDISWLQDEAALIALLDPLHQDTHTFTARDHYGRTFIHSLAERIRGNIAMSGTLRNILHRYSLHLTPDAFNSCPSITSTTPFGLPLPTFDSDDDDQPITSDSEAPLPTDQHVAMHARLLATVNDAFQNPATRDSRGRNSLHCLAAAIFSLQTNRPKKKPHRPTSRAASPAAAAASASANVGPFEHEDTSKERMRQRIETARNLIELGVDVNGYDVQGNTPLMVFVANSLENSADRSSPRELIKHLLDAGANVNARNRKGETALHIACRRGKKLALRALLDGGANVHVRDCEGRSVLDVLDDKFFNVQEGDGRQVHIREIAQFHVCRAVLAGTAVAAKQRPELVEEWRFRSGNGSGVKGRRRRDEGGNGRESRRRRLS